MLTSKYVWLLARGVVAGRLGKKRSGAGTLSTRSTVLGLVAVSKKSSSQVLIWVATLAAAVALALTSPAEARVWGSGTDDPAFADRIAAELGVKPGATVAEIRQRVANAGVGNVTVITATATDTGLPADSCDAIYMIYVYHHLTDPAAYDRSIFRALRPGGALFIADFYPTWLLGGMGVPQPQLVEQLTAAGFQTVHELTNYPPSRVFRQYCVLFRKPAATDSASPATH